MPHKGLQEDSCEMSVIMSRQSSPGSRALHVLFLDGGNGRAAQLAAHLARVLAGDHLRVEATDFGGMEPTALNGDQAGLVVVIHAPTAPGPVVVHSSGGRIDWYLEVNAITGCPFELTAQLRQHVIRLLGDLGIPQMHLEVSAKYLTDPSVALDLPIPVWLRTSPMELASGPKRAVLGGIAQKMHR